MGVGGTSLVDFGVLSKNRRNFFLRMHAPSGSRFWQTLPEPPETAVPTLEGTLEIIHAFLSHELPNKLLICSAVWEHFILLQGFLFISETLSSSDEPEQNMPILPCSLSTHWCWQGCQALWKLSSHLSLLKHPGVDILLSFKEIKAWQSYKTYPKPYSSKWWHQK